MKEVKELLNKYVEIKRIGNHGKYVILNTNKATLEKEINKLLTLYGVVSSFCPCGKVTNTKDCDCPDTNFTDDDLH